MNILNRTKASKVEMIKYKNLMVVIKYLENLGENEAEVVLWSLPKEGFLKNDIVDYFFKEAKKSEYVLMEKNKVNQIECSVQNKYFEDAAPMNILDIAIASNTEMIKSHKDYRRKAGDLNKIFILKNYKPDAALFSNNKNEKLSKFIEYLDNVGEADLMELHKCLPQNKIAEVNNLKHLILDLQNNEKIMTASIEHVTNKVLI